MFFYFFIGGLINFIVSIFFGYLIFSKDKLNRVNLTFSLFCFSVALWSLGYMFWPLSETRSGTLFWFQFLHIGASFTSIAYLHFVVIWLEKSNKINRIIIAIGYVLAIFFASQTFSSLFIADMVPKFSMRYWAVPGVLYHFYLVYFFGYFLYSSFLLLKSYLKTTGIKHAQIRLILLGMIIAFLGGSTNYLLWYNINFPPYGNIIVGSYVILTAYAITKYHLFNIKLFLARFLTIAIWVLIFTQFFFVQGFSSYILVSLTLIFAIVFGIFLINSVKIEVQRKEELEKLSAQLSVTNGKLHQLDKAKSEFISIASHQLRTPLTAIKGFVSLLLEGTYGQVPETQKGALEKVYISNERLVQLVEDLLNISRIESGRMEFDFQEGQIEDLITEAVNTLDLSAKNKGLYLEWKKPEKLSQKIKIDITKVKEVISNMIDNAIKYTQKGGVTVRTENGVFFDHNSMERKNVLRVIVSDTGIGMDKEDIGNIFDKFVRGKEISHYHTDGTGLGMFIAKKVTEAHQGKIWAESAGKGKGSRFILELPV